jgi:hypothetical protein
VSGRADPLRRLALARPDPDPDPERRGRVLTRALARPAIGAAPAIPRRRRQMRLAVLPAGVLAAAAVALLAAQLLQLAASGRESSPTASARSILLAAAVQAERAPAEAGRYWHVSARVAMLLPDGLDRTHHTFTDAPGQRWRLYPYQEDSWYASSASDRSVDLRQGDTVWPDCAAGLRGIDWWSRTLSVTQLQQLPADPARLHALLLDAVRGVVPGAPARGSEAEAQDVLSLAATLLDAPVAPDVRAAAYRVMASVPGTRSLGRVRDPLGRPGIGLAFSSPTGDARSYPWRRSEEVVIDPATGTLLATEDVAASSRDVRAGTPTYYRAVIAAGWTDQTPPTTPSQPCQLGG